MRQTRAGILCALAVMLAAGCAAQPQKRGASGNVDKLRADRDQAFADIEGTSPPATARESSASTPSKSPSPAKPDTTPNRPRPDWVGGAGSAKYPESEHIAGIGSCEVSGDDVTSASAIADNRARASVAESIRVRVKSEFNSAAMSVTVAATGKTTQQKDVSKVADRISSQAELDLDGVQIADRWRDGRAKRCWSLAVLERSTAGQAILDKMKRAQSEIAEDHKMGVEFRDQGAAFQAFRFLNRAEKKSLTLLNYFSQLRVIDPAMVAQAQSATAEPSVETTWRDATLAAENVRVGVITFAEINDKPTTTRQVEAELSQAVRDLGMKTMPVTAPAGAAYESLKEMAPEAWKKAVGNRANCLLLAKFSSHEVAVQKLVTMTVYFYQARAEGMLTDLDRGNVAASSSFDWLPKSHTGDPVAAQAAEGALRTAADQLGADISEELGKGMGNE